MGKTLGSLRCHALITELTWHTLVSLRVDDPEKAIWLQGVVGEIAITLLERLLQWPIHLVPPTKECICFEILLDLRIRAFFFIKEAQTPPWALPRSVNVKLLTSTNLEESDETWDGSRERWRDLSESQHL